MPRTLLQLLILGPILGLPLAAQRASQALPARLDRAFDLAGTDGAVQAGVLFDAGDGERLYVAGAFEAAGDQLDLGVASWDGERWASLGLAEHLGAGETYGAFEALCVHSPTGAGAGGSQLVVAGSIGGVPGGTVGVAMWDGEQWTTHVISQGTGFTPIVHALASDGQWLYAAGRFDRIGGVAAPSVARFDGQSWQPMGNLLRVGHALGFSDVFGATELLLRADQLYRWSGIEWLAVPGTLGSGPFVSWPDVGGTQLILENADGTLNRLTAQGTTPIADAPSDIRVLRVSQEGGAPTLYAGGDFTHAGALRVNRVARWDGALWSALGGTPVGVDGEVRELVSGLDPSGTGLLVAGEFRRAGTRQVANVATFEDGQWRPLGRGQGLMQEFASGEARAVALFDDGSGPALYVAGSFVLAGAQAIRDVARWDGERWSAVPGVSGLVGPVQSLCVWDDGNGPALYIGGSQILPNGRGVAYWKGGNLRRLGTGVVGAVRALQPFDDGTGPALWVGGRFSDAGGIAVHNLARWDGSVWSSIGNAGGATAAVNAMTVWDDGAGPELYVAGSFPKAGGILVNQIFAWDGTTQRSLAGGVQGTVRALAVADLPLLGGARLVVGGDFLTAGGLPGAQGLALWDGTSWAPPPAAQGTKDVRALAVWDDGAGPALFVAGDDAGAPTRVEVFEVLRPGGWQARALTGGGVRELTVMPETPGSSSLWLGGDFTSIDGTVAVGLARDHRPRLTLRTVPAATSGASEVVVEARTGGRAALLWVGPSRFDRTGAPPPQGVGHLHSLAPGADVHRLRWTLPAELAELELSASLWEVSAADVRARGTIDAR